MSYNPFRKPVALDELALRKLRERAAHAETLLRDETLAEAFVKVEDVYVRAWRASGALEIDVRERAHLAVLLLGDLKAQLLQFVAEGDAATAALTKEAERGKKRAA